MFLLINEEEMEIVAKHPNYGVLCDLGCIMCPDDALVIELDHNTFHKYDLLQLELLYIGLTLHSGLGDRTKAEREKIMLAYANELPETLLIAEQTAAQADYALQWGIEGYCSFLQGKKEPSDTEGLWENPNLDKGLEWELQVLAETTPLAFKKALQAPWR